MHRPIADFLNLYGAESFNSTMMASFLPVIVSKKNKQTKKNMSFTAV